MGRDNGGIDWLRVVVHSVVGLILGGILGTSAWVWLFDGERAALICIPVAALLVAIPAAVLGDRFWEWLTESGWWHWT